MMDLRQHLILYCLNLRVHSQKDCVLFFYLTDAYFPKSGGNISGFIGVGNGTAILYGHTDAYNSLARLEAYKDSNNSSLLQLERPLDDTTDPSVGLWQSKNGGGFYNVGYMLHTGNKYLIKPSDIGAPTVDEFNSLKTSVSEGKALIAAAVTGKGVSTAADATFQTMATNIDSIVTGSTGYTSVSDIRDTVNVGGGGSFSMSLISFEKGLITIRCSGRVPSGYQISGYIYIQLA